MTHIKAVISKPCAKRRRLWIPFDIWQTAQSEWLPVCPKPWSSGDTASFPLNIPLRSPFVDRTLSQTCEDCEAVPLYKCSTCRSRRLIDSCFISARVQPLKDTARLMWRKQGSWSNTTGTNTLKYLEHNRLPMANTLEPNRPTSNLQLSSIINCRATSATAARLRVYSASCNTCGSGATPGNHRSATPWKMASLQICYRNRWKRARCGPWLLPHSPKINDASELLRAVAPAGNTRTKAAKATNMIHLSASPTLSMNIIYILLNSKHRSKHRSIDDIIISSSASPARSWRWSRRRSIGRPRSSGPRSCWATRRCPWRWRPRSGSLRGSRLGQQIRPIHLLTGWVFSYHSEVEKLCIDTWK